MGRARKHAHAEARDRGDLVHVCVYEGRDTFHFVFSVKVGGHVSPIRGFQLPSRGIPTIFPPPQGLRIVSPPLGSLFSPRSLSVLYCPPAYISYLNDHRFSNQ